MKYFHHIYKMGKRKSVEDRRRIVFGVGVSYFDEDGIEYRKDYEFPKENSYENIRHLIPRVLGEGE